MWIDQDDAPEKINIIKDPKIREAVIRLREDGFGIIRNCRIFFGIEEK